MIRLVEKAEQSARLAVVALVRPLIQTVCLPHPRFPRVVPPAVTTTLPAVMPAWRT